jgi:very-short-patch-repair endonuclease
MRASVLELALQEALRRGLVDIARVADEWERLGKTLRPGGRVIEELLANFVRPVRHTDTTGESQLLQLIRAGGLPEPTPQHHVDISPTKSFKLDFAWPEAKVYCEFDPYKWHGARDKYMRDSKRRLQLAEAGWSGVPVTDDELDSGARLATQILRQHLARAG